MNSVRTTQRSKKGKWFVLINVLVFLFLVVAFGREYVGNIQIEHEIAALQAEKEQLEQNQLNTLTLIEQLSSEYYLESEARTKQGLGREGETVYVIQEGDLNQNGLNDGSQGNDERDVSNPVKWFQYFFDPVRFQELQS